nr:SAM-dependent methyltransferase [Thermoproteota archaeon]
APDFTPIDTFTHPFIFETKGTDSSKENLATEFENKSRFYLEQDANLQFAVITNMRDMAIYSKRTQMFVEEFSFSIQKLYDEGQHGMLAKSKNTTRFLAFIDKFKRRNLTYEQKLDHIIDSPPHIEHIEPPSKLYKQILNTKILSSIKHIVERLKSDVASQGMDNIDKLLANDPARKRFICNEINHILKETSSSSKQHRIEDFDHLKKVHANSTFENAVDLYFHRVAYFAMTRLLLIRAWEDAHFIGPDEVTLYDGGLGVWYRHLSNNIEKVLDHAYRIGKEKYEWLFKDDTNYFWYRPAQQVLIDVLYELAQYDFSELDKDILGTIYEQYLDRQDRKKKGQYYTHPKVVEFILDRVGFDHDSSFFNWEGGNRTPRFIYDCASGSGSFLVECARRIRDESKYDQYSLDDLLQIRDVIIKGLYGCEISAFAYYISEVNLLLQLTPIIKKILLLDPDQQRYQGKFTLGLLHENSLKLHAKRDGEIIERDIKKEYETSVGDEEYVIGKPESEKASVFTFIKNENGFDFCVANPPYIGESKHKELFRNTIRDIPYWKFYHEGKMDYLYWFIILALSKLKQGGKLGFITTSYWLTAFATRKLKKYILDNALIKEIIFFGQVKLFKDA